MNDTHGRFDRAMQHSGGERKTALLGLYKDTRDRECAVPVACLIFIRNMLSDPYEADYHLFRHSLICSMPRVALNLAGKLMEKPETLNDMMRENPIGEDSIAHGLLSGDLSGVLSHVKSLNASARACYETALLILKYDTSVSESFIHDAMTGDTRQNTHLFLLYLKEYMETAGKDRGFSLTRAFMEKHKMDNNALLYRLAVTCEENDPSRAYDLYAEIIRSGASYLDTEERMNKLTNRINGYKIKNTDENNNDIIF